MEMDPHKSSLQNKVVRPLLTVGGRDLQTPAKAEDPDTCLGPLAECVEPLENWEAVLA